MQITFKSYQKFNITFPCWMQLIKLGFNHDLITACWRLVMSNCVCHLDCPQGVKIPHYFWVCLWPYFQMRLASESVDLVKGTASPVCVGIIQSTEDLGRTKGRGRRNSSLLTCFMEWTGLCHLLFSCPQTGIHTIRVPGSQAFRLRPN